jgi:hypothetical protein
MKGLLTTMGLAVALSLGAQTVPEEKQQPAQQQQAVQQREPTNEEGKANAERTTKADHEKASTDRRVNQSERTNEGVMAREKSRSSEREGARVSQEGSRVGQQGGQVSHSTTVFRNGRQTNERLDLHRSFREQNDVHFRIGFHDRDWWIRSYSIVLMDGCHYYLADDGCWYPAYGFDPSCNYPVGVVYCD